jgi:hypothetical protein
MNFFDWMNMNMIIDIACVVFFGALIWKNKKTQKETLEERRVLRLELEDLRGDLNLVMKNPNAARRLLKERQ